jgi:hypothetical protein
MSQYSRTRKLNPFLRDSPLRNVIINALWPNARCEARKDRRISRQLNRKVPSNRSFSLSTLNSYNDYHHIPPTSRIAVTAIPQVDCHHNPRTNLSPNPSISCIPCHHVMFLRCRRRTHLPSPQHCLALFLITAPLTPCSVRSAIPCIGPHYVPPTWRSPLQGNIQQ